MTALLVVLLAAPLAAAVVVVFSRERARTVAGAVGTGVAAGWVVLVAATSGSDPAVVELGRLVAEPFLAAAAAGLALLVAAAPPLTAFATSAALTGLTVFPAAAAAGHPGSPDRPLAAGVLVLAVLAAGRARAERSSGTATVLVAAGALLVTVGLAVDDPERAAVLVVAGAGVVALVPAVFAAPGGLLLPVVLLAVQRTTAVPRPIADELDPVLGAALAVAVVGALALAAVRTRPVTQRLPVAGSLAAIVLLAADLTELRGAGLLLAAAAVLVAVGRHPVALVAGLPGVVAAVDAAALGTGAEHAAIGVAVVAVVAAGGLGSSSTPAVGMRWWPALPGALFGLVPLWGWAGVDLPHHTEALAVAAATGSVVLATTTAGPALRGALGGSAPPDEPAAPPPPPPRARGVRVRGSRLVARRSGSADPLDGIAHPDD